MSDPGSWQFDGFPPDSEVEAKHWLRDPMGRPILASWSRICYEFYVGETVLPGPTEMREQGWKYLGGLALPDGVTESDFPFAPDPDGYPS